MSTPSSPNHERPGRVSYDRRTSSLVGGFLKRSKSNDILGKQSSNNRGAKNIESEQEAALRRQTSNTPAPKLPGLPQQPQIQTFGGEDYRPPNMSDAPPVPPIPAGLGNGDTHGRTESMTHRGRYSYAPSSHSALSVNSPRRTRKRKDPTPYNILIIGARNAGKTSFLNFLKSSLALPYHKQGPRNPEVDSPPPPTKYNHGFTYHYQEIESDHERIGLTLWDSKGLDKNLVDLQSREISNFVESKFDDTFIEETRVLRAPGSRDTHIHCVFLILDPQNLDLNIRAAQQQTHHTVGALDEDFDIQVLKTLRGKTTVIPVISKSDTVTASRMAYLKQMVLASLKKAGLDPLEALNFEVEDTDDEEFEEEEVNAAVPNEETKADTNTEHDALSTVDATGFEAISPPVVANTKKSLTHKRDTSTLSISTNLLDRGFLPFSILSPDEHSSDGHDGQIGRKFPWGFADPFNPEHCDFVKLKDACFREWRADLREASREVFYESWRTSRLNRKTTNGITRSPPTPIQRKSSGGIPIVLDPSKKR